MTTTQPSLAASIDGFLRACAGKNRSPQTIRAYRTDLDQFRVWLHQENSYIETPADITTEDVLDYLERVSKPRRRVLAPPSWSAAGPPVRAHSLNCRHRSRGGLRGCETRS